MPLRQCPRRKIGVEAPRIWEVSTTEAMRSILPEIRYPCAIKGRLSVEFWNRLETKLLVAEGESELVEHFARVEDLGLDGPFEIQPAPYRARRADHLEEVVAGRHSVFPIGAESAACRLRIPRPEGLSVPTAADPLCETMAFHSRKGKTTIRNRNKRLY